jgi:hypothetical protein
MKPLFANMLVISTALILASCNEGSSAPPPTDVTVVPGDGVVTVSWTTAPSVDYFLYYVVGNSVSRWTTGTSSVISVSSPYVLTGLTNDTTYTFTMDGRTNGGPAGSASPSISATPRLAGATWNSGTALGATLRGATYGTLFAAVGDSGVIQTSPDGKTWTSQTSGVSANLNAAVYGGSYLAAGAGGVILLSADAITWTSETSGTANNLNGLGSNGAFYLAVGDNGTILTSSGGASWTVPTSGTSNALYAVTYGNSRYVAVGASGTILTSADAVTWQAATSPVITYALKGVTYGLNTSVTPSVGVFVATGGNGTLLTSADGITWTQQAAIQSNPAINAVTYGTQFVAVGDTGGIFTSTDGITWIAPTSVTPSNANNLYAIAHGNHGYASVGLVGANLTAY